jgi:translocation and assembly module TamB
VTAQLKGVSVDTVLSVVSRPPFERLGFNALVSGPATAVWAHGDVATTVVSAKLALSLGAQVQSGERPITGTIDATYAQRDGSVEVRNLDLETPGDHLQARGRVGAYPVQSPSAIAIELESRDLGEFDTLLRDLGLHRGSKSGVAAIPVSLGGQAEFHGMWTGSLSDPHIAGNLTATKLVLEMPSPTSNPAGQARLVRLDSADVTGSYAAAKIEVDHASLVSGSSQVDVSGTLQAPPDKRFAVDSDSILQASLLAKDVPVDELRPFTAAKVPVSGTLDTQIKISGPLHAPAGSGWIELDSGTIYGEPFHRARLAGTLSRQMLKLTSITLSAPAGEISGSGEYDMSARRFKINADGSNIEISRIAWLKQRGLEAAGKLSFSLSGSGIPDDPNFTGQATLTTLTLGGEPLGAFELRARTSNHALVYSGTTRIEGADLTLHGQTSLASNYATSASLTFSRFNVAALLKLANVEGLTADSSLAGTISVSGPLTQPAQMRGEARLRELAVTLAGVHLKSEGGLHATLAENRITLDPLHITGEDTDLSAQGQLSLNGARRLDLVAKGSINLKLAQTLDPDLTANGTTTFQVEAHGPVRNPSLQGRIDFQECSLSLGDLPNGLSQLHGTLVFNQNRLEVKTLTAMSGGGLLSVGGYLAYQRGIFADLTVTGQGIRIRYPRGISSLADAKLRLQGPQDNLLLAGNVLITRFTVSPDLDVAALAAQANAAVEKIAPPEAPSNHIRLDLHLVSSPQLNFQNA